MPKGYIIGHIEVTDPEGYPEYVARDTPVLHGHGGRFVVRGGRYENREGDAAAMAKTRHVVIEFDSFEAAKAAFDDPAYQEVAEIRRRCARSTMVLVEGTE